MFVHTPYRLTPTLFLLLSSDLSNYVFSSLLAAPALDLTPDQAGVYPNKPSGPVPRSAQVSTLRIREQDLVDLLVNKTLAPAQAFILGKLKISGSNQSMFKFHHFWHGNHGPEEGKRENTTQAQETKSVEQEEHAQLAKDALKSDVVFGFFRARLEKEPDLVKTLAFVVQVDILKAGKLVATWSNMLIKVF